MEWRNNVVDLIWGSQDDPGVTYTLHNYVQYCVRELERASIFIGPTRADNESSVAQAINILKANTFRPRTSIEREHGITPVKLDIACRVMLMTACQTPGTVGGDIFRPRWKPDESLCQYIHRIYPESPSPPEEARKQPVSLFKFGADFLTRYTDIDIRWTDRLTDHLILIKGPTWKSLHVFAHPSFLLKSLETIGMEERAIDTNIGGPTSLVGSLSKGCLPAQLLRETLLTFELLFPPVDDIKSRRILHKQVIQHSLDTAFLQQPFHTNVSFEPEHNTPQEAKHIADVKGLYDRYPYWASRLHDFYSEAEDPTPLTYIGKFSERKRSPRFAYWCTFLGISIAIMFGVMSTLLGALQVWNSYCSWMRDEGSAPRGCPIRS